MSATQPALPFQRYAANATLDALRNQLEFLRAAFLDADLRQACDWTLTDIGDVGRLVNDCSASRSLRLLATMLTTTRLRVDHLQEVFDTDGRGASRYC